MFWYLGCVLVFLAGVVGVRFAVYGVVAGAMVSAVVLGVQLAAGEWGTALLSFFAFSVGILTSVLAEAALRRETTMASAEAGSAERKLAPDKGGAGRASSEISG